MLSFTFKRLMMLSAAVVLVLAGVLVLLFRPVPSGGTCAIGFVNFTNDVSGRRVALFAITNTHDRSIRFMPCTRVQTAAGWPAPDDLDDQSPVFSDRWHVPSHTSITFSVVPPTNNVTWRVDAFYKQEPPLRGKVLHKISRLLEGCGVQWEVPSSLYPRDWEHAIGPERAG